MLILERAIPKNCDIVLHGDSHDGNAMTATDEVQKVIDWVLEERNRYMIHMGDAIEAIATDDKRYHDESSKEPIPLRQAMAVAHQYKPAAKRVLAWLWGNHENKLERFGNLTRDVILHRMGIPEAYGGWTCKLRLTCGGQQVLKMFLTHGVRGPIGSNAKDFEQQRANMAAAVKRKLAQKAGDCLLMAMGHSHKLIVVPPSQRLILGDDGQRVTSNYLQQGDGAAPYIEPDSRWYLNTGAFLRLYKVGVEGYAERAGYDPTELGYCVAEIRNGRLANVRRVVI